MLKKRMDDRAYLQERVDGFPYSFGQIIDMFVVINRNPVSYVEIASREIRSKIDRSKTFRHVTIKGPDWKVTCALWFDALPSDLKRIQFDGNADKFSEYYVWLKLIG
jgi:hypothetical protein